MSKIPEYIEDNEYLRRIKYLSRVSYEETFGFDSVFACYLLERIKRYKDEAIKSIDLSFHKFTIENKVYTQIEVIDIIIKNLEYYFESIDCNNKEGLDKESEQMNCLKKATHMFAEILPSMWW